MASTYPLNEYGITQLQERAAQLYVEGRTKSDAYREAGYSTENCTDKTINEAASRLFADSKVSARVEQLRAIHRKRHEVTVDSITAEYEEVREAAFRDGDYSPAVSAITGKAKLHGLIVDKATVTNKISLADLVTQSYQVKEEKND